MTPPYPLSIRHFCIRVVRWWFRPVNISRPPCSFDKLPLSLTHHWIYLIFFHQSHIQANISDDYGIKSSPDKVRRNQKLNFHFAYDLRINRQASKRIFFREIVVFRPPTIFYRSNLVQTFSVNKYIELVCLNYYTTANSEHI